MKKQVKLQQWAAIGGIALCAAFLWACEKDEVPATVISGTTENRVFINNGLTPVTLPKNTAVFSGLINTPVGTQGARVTTTFGVQSTKPAEKRIRVKLEIDRSDVPEGYTPLPDAIGIIVEDAELTILEGQTRSEDNITVTLDEDLRPLASGRYAFAIRIVSATGGAQVSTNLSTVYIVLQTTYTNVQQGATSVSGSTMTKPTGAASWTVAGIATNPQYMLDASTSTQQYAATGSLVNAFPKEIVVDMKAEYTINGVHTRTSSNSYCPTAANIYTRLAETDEWTLQGYVTWARGTIQYVRFYGPVTTRYVRIDIMSVYNVNYGARYTDFTIYR
ncbi:MAG: discoidin domain-containing protein [Prevotellaceae bacterium]|jgi:hypothetical protein|nr:discoidin domain-containing protein [Prevotellaceae bacterium]